MTSHKHSELFDYSDPLQLAAWAYEYPDFISTPVPRVLPESIPLRAYCGACKSFGTLAYVEGAAKKYLCRSCGIASSRLSMMRPRGSNVTETRHHAKNGIESRADPFLINRIRSAVESTSEEAQRFFFYAHTSRLGKIEAKEHSIHIVNDILIFPVKHELGNVPFEKMPKIYNVVRAIVLASRPGARPLKTHDLAMLAETDTSQFRGAKWWARLRDWIYAVLASWDHEIIEAMAENGLTDGARF